MKIKRPGFGLIELLVIIAIIAILIAMLIPAVQKVRQAVTRTETINNLKQCCLATHSAHDAWHILPCATGSYGGASKASYSLSVHLLPFIESMPVYQEFAVAGKPMPSTLVFAPYQAKLDFTTGDWVRVQNFAANLRVFTDTGFSTNYSQVMPVPNPGGWSSRSLVHSFPDGTSNTIMYTTRSANNGALKSGGDVNCSSYDALLATGTSGAFFGAYPATTVPTSGSVGGWQLNPTLSQANCSTKAYNAMSFQVNGLPCGMCDGSVHTASNLISSTTWNCAVQPNDLLPLGTDW